jgi:hypothetical protein
MKEVKAQIQRLRKVNEWVEGAYGSNLKSYENYMVDLARSNYIEMNEKNVKAVVSHVWRIEKAETLEGAYQRWLEIKETYKLG